MIKPRKGRAAWRPAPMPPSLLFSLLLCLLLACGAAVANDTLRIGSKRFTESYILGEILRQTAMPHAKTEHRQGLGNTAIVFEALKSGGIDLYPEYLGTIDQEILKHDRPSPLEAINRELAPLGLGAAVPLGFGNSYALAARGGDGIAGTPRTLSELARRPGLRIGLSHEFLGRADGWPGLARRYKLPQHPVGLDHGIAYEALAKRQVDVIDIYSTDAKIRQYGLAVLRDDAHYFPSYQAVLLYRLDVARRFPQAWQALRSLQGRISEADMIAMNAEAELDGRSFADIASAFLFSQRRPGAGATQTAQTAGAAATLRGRLFGDDLWRLTRQHLLLVAAAVVLAAALGIPLGILAAYAPRMKQFVMAAVGVLQTIPALALLAMLIPLLGTIGALPALVALFLYALLPVVRNTAAGIEQVPRGLRLAALALGLTPRQCLLHIELPLAMPVILAGLKTAAVMSVGTATIAAFIGAGGYGERIATGLALNDNAMLLAGAIPAALLALLTQLLFELVEKLWLRTRYCRFS